MVVVPIECFPECVFFPTERCVLERPGGAIRGLCPVSGESERRETGSSVVPRSSFLHAGGLGLGDVLVVGLVLQFPAEVLDCFIQAFFQRHLQDTQTKIVRWVRQVEGVRQVPGWAGIGPLAP